MFLLLIIYFFLTQIPPFLLRIYVQQLRSSRPLPHPSSFYNNPSFTIPPHPSNDGPVVPPQFPNNHLPSVPPISPHPFAYPPPDPSAFYHKSHVFPPAYTQPFPYAPPRHPLYPYFHPDATIRPPPPPTFHATSYPSGRSSPSPTLSKTLPTVTHIPILTLKHDFRPQRRTPIISHFNPSKLRSYSRRLQLSRESLRRC